MANVTVSVPVSNVTVSSTNNIVSVGTTTSNIIVSSSALLSNADVRAAISVVDAGGDGSVSYDTGAEAFSSGSYNVQSVANTSTTKRTITFSTPLSDVNYFVSVTGTAASSATNFYATVINKTVNGFVIDGAEASETSTFSFDFVVFGSTLSA